MPLPDSTDWLEFCRRAADAARDAVHAYGSTAERAVETGRGEGGDTAYVIDRAAEDAVFAEIEALGVPVLAVSEERGEVASVRNGGTRATRAHRHRPGRRLPQRQARPAVRMRVDRDRLRPRMGDVEVGWVAELDPRLTAADEPRRGRDWWAVKGEGAFRDGEAPRRRFSPGALEVLGLETARPELVAAAASAIESRGRAPHPRARLGGDDALPRGRRPARRDGLACARSAPWTPRRPSCS